LFRADDGAPVNPVDIGRALRQNFSVVQHQFVQRADGTCLVRLRPAYGMPINSEQVVGELRALFGRATSIDVQIDDSPATGEKWVPYRQERPGMDW
jgi:hypothetical protein